MFYTIFKSELDLFTNMSYRQDEKTILRTRKLLLLLIISILYFSDIQAANISCTWTGGALSPGNWTDPNWNSDAGCSGTFPNNNSDTFDATHPRGTINLDQDIEIEIFNLQGGTLTGTNTLTVNDTFNWTRGTVAGSVTIRAAGGIELSGSSSKTFKDSAIVINGAGQVANWSQGNITMNNGESGFVNEAGANFNITADDSRMNVFAHGPKFDNGGILTTNLSGADNNVTINSSMNNSGQVNVITGELRLGGGGSSNGAFIVGEQGKLNFRGGEHVLLASSSVTGSNVEFSQPGTTTIEGTYNVGNTGLKAGSIVNFNVDSQTQTLTMDGGKLNGSASMVVSGKTTFTSGEMGGTGITFANGGLDFNGNFMSLRDGRVLALGGTLSNWTDGTILLRDESTVLFNQPGSLFRVAADQGIIFGKGVLANAGAMVVDLPDGAQPVVIKSNLTNLGALVLQGDNLVIGSQTPPNILDTQLSVFNGNFVQTETGTTFFDIDGNIAGDEYDVLNVVENAFLNGFFNINLTFNPSEGDVFDILVAKSIVDSGLSLNGLSGDLFDFSIVDLDTGNQALRLTFVSSVAAVPIPAAFWLFLSALFILLSFTIRQSVVKPLGN